MKTIKLENSKATHRITALNGESYQLIVDGRNGEVLDKYDIEIIHDSPELETYCSIKVICPANKVINVTATVYVTKAAEACDTYLNMRGLLLGDGAKLNLTPCMEIHQTSVKAGHGASISQLDNNQVNYLRSRGIETETATNMLTEAFLQI